MEKSTRYCKKCGKEILEGKHFCGYCKTAVTQEESSAPKPVKTSGSDSRVILSIVLVILVILILSGGIGAFYIVRSAMNQTAFAEKLSFLPFVYSDKEGEIRISDPESDASLYGDWTCETDSYILMARFKTDHTFFLLQSDFDNLDCQGIIGTYEMPSAAGETDISLADTKGSHYLIELSESLFTINVDNNTYTFEKSKRTDADILGAWQKLSGHGNSILNFQSNGAVQNGEIDHYGEVHYYGNNTLLFDYDDDANVLLLSSPDDTGATASYYLEIMGTYALFAETDGTVSVLSKNLKYDSFYDEPAAFAEGTDASVNEYTISNSDYILPTSDSTYLSARDLYGLTLDELRIARNEIYARHGRLFSSQDLQTYFNGKSWYRGTIQSDKFSDSLLNTIEKENIKLIQKTEEQLQ